MGMATYSSILAQRIPPTGGLQPMGSQSRAQRSNWTTTLGYNSRLYYSLLKLFHHHLLGAPAVCSYIPWTCPLALLLECVFYFWHYIMLYVHFAYSLPSPTTCHFSKKSWYLLWENDIRNQSLGTGCAHCFQTHSVDRVWKYKCTS